MSIPRLLAALLAAGLALLGPPSADAAGETARLRGYSPTRNPRVIEVFFETDPCTRFRRAGVREGRRRVVVTVFTRRTAEVCIQVVAVRVRTVCLRAPLRARGVVDGSRRRRVPRLSQEEATRLRRLARRGQRAPSARRPTCSSRR